MLSTLKASCKLLAFTFWELQILPGASAYGLDLFERQNVYLGIVGGLVIGLNEACPANSTKCDTSGLTNTRAICCPSTTTSCYRKTVNNQTWPYCCLTGMDCSNVGPVNQVCGDPDWIPCFTPSQYKCCEANQVCTYDFGEGCYDSLPTVSTGSLTSWTSRSATSTSTSAITTTSTSTSTTDPAHTTTSSSTSSTAPVQTGLSPAAVGGIAGGVAIAVILVAVALGVGICLGRRRRKAREIPPPPVPDTTPRDYSSQAYPPQAYPPQAYPPQTHPQHPYQPKPPEPVAPYNPYHQPIINEIFDEAPNIRAPPDPRVLSELG